MRREQLDEVLRTGEGQTVEFKTSFAEQKEAIQSMVSFANAQGGRVFIGVQDDGTVVGVRIGKNTLEKLAADIRDHTYPSLAAFIEQVDCNGEKIVVVEVAADTPPVIGAYLWSADPVSPDKAADAEKLQAYRRVGRANLKEDFMRLRRPQPTDPKLRIALQDSYLNDPRPGFTGRVWVEEGSATAHDVAFSVSLPACECPDAYDDLPFHSESTTEVPGAQFSKFKTEHVVKDFGRFRFSCGADLCGLAPSSIRLIATYKDDWGLTWASARRLELVVREEKGQQVRGLVDGGEFTRRIIRFPPKERR
jgi:hypothetical protein